MTAPDQPRGRPLTLELLDRVIATAQAHARQFLKGDAARAFQALLPSPPGPEAVPVPPGPREEWGT